MTIPETDADSLFLLDTAETEEERIALDSLSREPAEILAQALARAANREPVQL